MVVLLFMRIARAFALPFLLFSPFSTGHAQPAPNELVLPVRYHHQEHSLSCEAAALKTVLDYYGMQVTEDEILKRMPFDTTPHERGIWGDPNVAFVGDVDGQMGVNGYGIHSQALQRVSSHWRRTALIRGGRVEELTAHLEQRRPVIVWGYERNREALRWKTKDGRPVEAIAGEHTRVVYGFKGDARAPAGFYVMDPLSGPRYWDTRAFLENWDSLGRTGIVLYEASAGPDKPTSENK